MEKINIDLRPIPGRDGWYAGSDGHMYSILASGGRGGRRKLSVPHKLQEFVNKDGSRTVNCRGMSTQYVHRLIALAFHGLCPDGMECSHKNGNPSDNVPNNLLWETHADNEMRKRSHGTSPHGSRNGRSKLTEDQVAEIKRLGREAPLRDSGSRRKDGYVKVVADQFGVSPKAITNIWCRQTWRNGSR